MNILSSPQIRNIKRIFFMIGLLILSLVFGYAAWSFSALGLNGIEQLRQLERIPQSRVVAVLPGEIQLHGQVQALHKTLRSPKAGVTSVYYRYRVERRCKDSDGNESWCEHSNERKFVNFVLRDSSGGITVVPAYRAEWNAPLQYQQVEGQYRYTEWRIEPGESLWIFGWISERSGVDPAPERQSDVSTRFEVVFNNEGHYTPIISYENEGVIHSDLGTEALAYIGLSLGALALALLCVICALQIHRLLVLISVQCLVLTLGTISQGLVMLERDLVAAQAGIAQKAHYSKAEIQSILARAGAHSLEDFALLSDSRDVARVQGIRAALADSINTYNGHVQRFPVAWLAYAWGVKPMEAIALTDQEQSLTASMGYTERKSKLLGMSAWVVTGVSFMLMLGLTFAGLRAVRFKRMIESLPTSKVKGAMLGLVELSGYSRLISDKSLAAPLTGKPSVWYRYCVKEKRTRGKKTSWVTIEDRHDSVAFYCEDDTGSLKIVPDNAEIMTDFSTRRRRGNRLYHEWRLEPNKPLYAIGHCGVDINAGDKLQLKKAGADVPFILSHFPEQEVMLKKARSGMTLLTLGLSASVVLCLFLLGIAGGFSLLDLLTAAFVPSFYLLIVTFVLHYNDMIFLRQRVNRNWSNIDVFLQKRFDLIKALNKVVKEFMSHEKTLQEQLAQLRTANKNATSDVDALAAYEQGERAFAKTLSARLEAYPELKSNELIQRFMTSYSELETELALIRSGYNDAVTTYNQRLESFPDLIFAKFFGFIPKELLRFEAEPG